MSPACQTIVQTYLGSLELLRAAAAASVRLCTATHFVIGTACVNSNLCLHCWPHISLWGIIGVEDNISTRTAASPGARAFGTALDCSTGLIQA